MADTIVWTPEESLSGLGTVRMKVLPGPLPLSRYQGLLSSRIDRLVAHALETEGEAHVQHLMDSLVWQYDRLSVNPPFKGLGLLMVENSDHLRREVGMDRQEWPIPPDQIKPDPDGEATLDPNEVPLEQYLLRLYE